MGKYEEMGLSRQEKALLLEVEQGGSPAAKKELEAFYARFPERRPKVQAQGKPVGKKGK